MWRYAGHGAHTSGEGEEVSERKHIYKPIMESRLLVTQIQEKAMLDGDLISIHTII